MIPDAYRDNGELADAYTRGWNHGHGIACHNVPTIGRQLFIESLGRVMVDVENIRQVHESLCFEAEQHSRQYSPFEFTAHEFNQHGQGDEETVSSDELWEAFDAGIADAIHADLANYTDEDYGITTSDI